MNWQRNSSAPNYNIVYPSIPGREIVQVLTEIPAGVESGWHMHSGEEVGYILAGTVKMMIQGQPLLRYPLVAPFYSVSHAS